MQARFFSSLQVRNERGDGTYFQSLTISRREFPPSLCQTPYRILLPRCTRLSSSMEVYLRQWMNNALSRHQYDTAIFVGDKLLALTSDLTPSCLASTTVLTVYRLGPRRLSSRFHALRGRQLHPSTFVCNPTGFSPAVARSTLSSCTLLHQAEQT